MKNRLVCQSEKKVKIEKQLNTLTIHLRQELTVKKKHFIDSANGYNYNGDGRRVRQGNSTGMVHYLWSSLLGEPVVELDEGGGVYRAYVYGPGGGLLGLQAYDFQFYWVHQDHLGSTRRLTDGSGAEVYRAEFDPHGQMLEEWALDGQLYKDSRKFTGYERDWTTNLDNAKARMYAGKVGRFMQPDPLGAAAADAANPQSLNRYSYVGNDPVNYTDPNGLAPYLPGAADVWSSVSAGFWGGGWNFNDRPLRGFRDILEGEMRNFPWTQVRIPGFEGQFVSFPSMFGDYSLWGGYGWQTQQPETDCRRFANLVEQIANDASGVEDFFDRMARTFTAANDSGINEMSRTANNGLPAGRPTFGSSGFKQQFRDQSNQVRHFTGGLIAGFRLGYLPALLFMNSRETPGIDDADIALNSESTWMGHNFGAYPGSKAYDAYGGYRKLADAIRRRVCD